MVAERAFVFADLARAPDVRPRSGRLGSTRLESTCRRQATSIEIAKRISKEFYDTYYDISFLLSFFLSLISQITRSIILLIKIQSPK